MPPIDLPAAIPLLTTVSPTYAREILTAEGGCGLHGLLRQRSGDLVGILNGVDYTNWDPALDQNLPCAYSQANISGKRVCKEVMQGELGLDTRSEVPLIAFLSRLTHQKMADIVIEALPTIMQRDVQFALIGQGDEAFEQAFLQLAKQHDRRIAVRTRYDERMAHRLQVGADILLHPSRFEPCGLSPMYGLRYGTLPVVRPVGGQADVVVDAAPHNLAQGTATGFAFQDPTCEAMCVAVDRAITVFLQPVTWRKMQLEAMRQDFGWSRPASEYMALYRSLTARSEPESGDTEGMLAAPEHGTMRSGRIAPTAS